MKSVREFLQFLGCRKEHPSLYLSPVLHVEVRFENFDKTFSKELCKRVKQYLVPGCRVLVQSPQQEMPNEYMGELRLMDGRRLIFRERLKPRVSSGGTKSIEFERM